MNVHVNGGKKKTGIRSKEIYQYERKTIEKKIK